VLPLPPDIHLAEIPQAQLDRRDGRGNTRGIHDGPLQQPFHESVTHPVALIRVEQKSQESGVSYLLPDETDRLEDVEPIQQGFQPLKVWVIDDEALKFSEIRCEVIYFPHRLTP